ncbi:MAG: methylthioribulose-1-phosphate dehydratase, partial [Marinobacter alexandrii]
MFDVTQYAIAADQIVDAGRFLYQRGWSPATSSNYS